jgi:Glycine rich protein
MAPGSYLLTVSSANAPNNVVASFDVTIAAAVGGSDGGVPHGMQEFTTPGPHLFLVPQGVTRLLVEVWGAGGGSAGIGEPCILPAPGGAGAYSRAILNVAAGDNVTITVGQGGGTASPGGFSSIADGPNLITSGGGQPGQPDCSGGAPGTPDPNAPIGRSNFPADTRLPAFGTIQPIGAFGGALLSPGGDGYVLIQW